MNASDGEKLRAALDNTGFPHGWLASLPLGKENAPAVLLLPVKSRLSIVILMEHQNFQLLWCSRILWKTHSKVVKWWAMKDFATKTNFCPFAKLPPHTMSKSQTIKIGQIIKNPYAKCFREISLQCCQL